MKVLMIGVYLDGSGWSHASIDYALALDSVGVDVVLRAVKQNAYNGPVHPRIRELLDKSSEGCDVCIQIMLPHLMESTGNFRKNIGIFFSEGDNFKATDWPLKLSLMDEVWVPSNHGLQACLNSHVEANIEVVHPPCDPARYSRSYAPFKLREELADRFIFYSIGEFNKRKNWSTALLAFHAEFDPDEPVEFLIKTTPPTTKQQVIDQCSLIKRGMRLYPRNEDYKRELIWVDYMSDNDIARVHATGDCFVSVSHGEGWGLPAFESLAFGKQSVLSSGHSYDDFADESNAWMVPTYSQLAYGSDEVISNLHTSRELWRQVDHAELMFAMRQAYENRNSDFVKYKTGQGRRVIDTFSYRTIAQQMKELISD